MDVIFNMFYPCNKSSNSNQLVSKTKNEFTTLHIQHFLNLIEDEMIQEFLEFDRCFKLADKYLLSMVFVYFIRASLPFSEYTRANFFIALYLAHDVEEDEENLKYCFVDWGFGASHKKEIRRFIKLRDKLWKDMDYRACVSLKCCHQIMQSFPDCVLWKRERSPSHGGAIRDHDKQTCDRCELKEKRYYTSDGEDSSESNGRSNDAEELASPPCKIMKRNEE